MLSENNQSSHNRKIKSFVNREGRLSPRLQNALDLYADKFVISDFDKAVEFLTQIKQTNARKIILEIGSGQGNQLVESAKKDPETLFIGAEVYKTGVAHTLFLATNKGTTEIIPNILMFNCDIVQILQKLKSSGIAHIFDEIWTFFPDPWPKLRHRKRRLVQNDFLELIKNSLKPNCLWRLATDWENYAIHMQNVLNVAQAERFNGRVLTNFEKKGIAAKRKIYDYSWQNSF